MTLTPIGRLAPSPTGGLHVGHARTFLAAWLAARHRGGKMILRIEDLDASRVRPGLAQAAIEDLLWLGLDWDEGPDVGGPDGPYTQSERGNVYAAALQRLIEANLVYPCHCTRADLARLASAPHADDDQPVIVCQCRARHATAADTLRERNIPFAWRFRVPDRTVAWSDACAGPITLNPAASGDFIVARSSGEFGYQLAVVVDDASMGVNQVVRGDDLIPSTPRQLLIYEALELEPPNFAHLPLVLDERGKRLAKRDSSLKLATLRRAGVSADAMRDLLASSLGLTGAQNWLEDFRFDTIPREPWRFRDAALRHFPG